MDRLGQCIGEELVYSCELYLPDGNIQLGCSWENVATRIFAWSVDSE
jgi:hypothetical protein